MAPLLLSQAELSDRQFTRISNLVRDLCGINLHAGKKELVKARLSKRLRKLGMSSFEDYTDFVRSDRTGNELTNMLDALCTNLTSFFREPAHFRFLSEHVVEKARRRDSRGKQLRIWSAGCASGEEAYSIAISLCESIDDVGLWDAKILGTDLSTKVVAAARDGVYEHRHLEVVSPAVRSRYFVPVQVHPKKLYRVKPTLRRMAHFARLNLMDAWPMRGPFDAIFCRNVMIYFNKPTQAALIGRFWNLLAPGGLLFVGHSESLAGVQHSFRYVQPTVYEKP